jgi:hypothetical protein
VISGIAACGICRTSRRQGCVPSPIAVQGICHMFSIPNLVLLVNFQLVAYRLPYKESVSVHFSNASSPSKNSIWMPISIATEPPSPKSLISLYMRVTY